MSESFWARAVGGVGVLAGFIYIAVVTDNEIVRSLTITTVVLWGSLLVSRYRGRKSGAGPVAIKKPSPCPKLLCQVIMEWVLCGWVLVQLPGAGS